MWWIKNIKQKKEKEKNKQTKNNKSDLKYLEKEGMIE